MSLSSLFLTHDANQLCYTELNDDARFALVQVVSSPVIADSSRELAQGMLAAGTNPETGDQVIWIDVQDRRGFAARYERKFSHDVPAAFAIYWAQETLGKTNLHKRLLQMGFTYED